VLRRAHSVPEQERFADETEVVFDRWTFNIAKRQLRTSDGVVNPLSTGEFNLLLTFVQHPGHVLNRDQLIDLTQGRDSTPFDRSIDTQVSRLRKRVEVDPKDPQIIKTVWGGGYVFTPTVEKT
jgi:two-component system OmpR family response regulator